jgi:hypothetical protein
LPDWIYTRSTFRLADHIAGTEAAWLTGNSEPAYSMAASTTAASFFGAACR